MKKKLLVFVAVFCLALFTCGAASAATNPYADWYLGGDWDVSVSVSEFAASDDVFPEGFDPALRNSFLDLQAGYKNAGFRAVLPLIAFLVPEITGDDESLADAVKWIEEYLPYDLRMAIPALIDIIFGNFREENRVDGDPNWEKMEAELQAALRQIYFPITPDHNVGDFSESAANLIVRVVNILYDALLMIEDPELEIAIIPDQLLVTLRVNLKQLETLLFDVLYGKHAADLNALLTYVAQHPSILTSLGAYMEDDPLQMIYLAKDADILQSYKTAASAAGTGAMLITSTAKSGDIAEEITKIESSYLLTGGAAVSWNTVDPLSISYFHIPVIENEAVTLAPGG
ncbi:hypothetical protein LJC40_07395, partial [Synergistaceae bacterium OttesenSCG-928-D05]|nr:hypothetical protein [Synergistaceae bacterium OttesenSCG-928-D05]